MAIKYGSRVRLGNSTGTVVSITKNGDRANVEFDYNGAFSEWPIRDLHEMNAYTLSVWNSGNEYVEDEFAYLHQIGEWIRATYPGTEFKVSNGDQNEGE